MVIKSILSLKKVQWVDISKPEGSTNLKTKDFLFLRHFLCLKNGLFSGHLFYFFCNIVV